MAVAEKVPTEEVKKPKLYSRHHIAGEAATAMAAVLMMILSLFIIVALLSSGEPKDVKYLVGIFFFAVLVGLFTAIVETYNFVKHAITRQETMLQGMHGLPLEDLE